MVIHQPSLLSNERPVGRDATFCECGWMHPGARRKAHGEESQKQWHWVLRELKLDVWVWMLNVYSGFRTILPESSPSEEGTFNQFNKTFCESWDLPMSRTKKIEKGNHQLTSQPTRPQSQRVTIDSLWDDHCWHGQCKQIATLDISRAQTWERKGIRHRLDFHIWQVFSQGWNATCPEEGRQLLDVACDNKKASVGLGRSNRESDFIRSNIWIFCNNSVVILLNIRHIRHRNFNFNSALYVIHFT